MNVVSLLPSATEIICSLGLRDSLVGVSHSCDFPADVVGLPVLTSTTIPSNASSAEIDRHVRAELTTQDALYTLDVEALQRLEPDVIVAQTLCDVCAVSSGDVLSAIAGLPTRPALVELEPTGLNDLFSDIRRVGATTQTSHRADAVVADLAARLDAVRKRTDRIPEVTVPGLCFWSGWIRLSMAGTGTRRSWSWPGASIVSAPGGCRHGPSNGRKSHARHLT